MVFLLLISLLPVDTLESGLLTPSNQTSTCHPDHLPEEPPNNSDMPLPPSPSSIKESAIKGDILHTYVTGMPFVTGSPRSFDSHVSFELINRYCSAHLFGSSCVTFWIPQTHGQINAPQPSVQARVSRLSSSMNPVQPTTSSDVSNCNFFPGLNL